MAGYVSSYPTLWSVFDMLIPSLQRGSRAKKEGEQTEKMRKWSDPDHNRVTSAVISAHFVIYPAREGECFIVIHLG